MLRDRRSSFLRSPKFRLGENCGKVGYINLSYESRPCTHSSYAKQDCLIDSGQYTFPLTPIELL